MTDPEECLQSASAKHAIGRLLHHLSDLWLACISVYKYALCHQLLGICSSILRCTAQNTHLLVHLDILVQLLQIVFVFLYFGIHTFLLLLVISNYRCLSVLLLPRDLFLYVCSSVSEVHITNRTSVCLPA